MESIVVFTMALVNGINQSHSSGLHFGHNITFVIVTLRVQITLCPDMSNSLQIDIDVAIGLSSPPYLLIVSALAAITSDLGA